MQVLDDDDFIEILRLTYNEGRSSREVAEIIGCSKTTIGSFLRREGGYNEFWEKYDDKPVAAGETKSRRDQLKKLSGKSFVITSAQNNTYVHDGFLSALKVYAEKNDAEIIVGTFHYNKNAYQKSDSYDTECWFDPKIRDYILDEDCELAESLMWCGSLDIIPTAVNPMTGLHSYTGCSSGIFPHAKVQLESLPTGKFSPAKIMYTTGSVTQLNYIQRKAGQIAEFHHMFGALSVTIDDDGDWFVRQLIADSDTGSFHDLDYYYDSDSFTSTGSVEAINWGDVHAAKLDNEVANASWLDSDSMLDRLKPKRQFLHDIFDMEYRNHHSIGNHYFRYKMFVNQTESVKEEIKLTSNVIASMDRDFSQIIIVQSNHDLALKKWLSEQDYRNDPVNAEFFLELQLASYKAISSNDSSFAIFEYACKSSNEALKDVLFLREDESYQIAGGIECGQHGHNGNNGARGSVRSLQISGSKSNSGHTHSATIKDGVYIAGVSGKLDMGYNIGGSSWSNSHIVTYSNGKRAIITLRNGKWRATNK